MAYLAFAPIIDGPTGALAWGPVLAPLNTAPIWPPGVTLPPAVAEAPYSASVAATGTPPPTYSIINGPHWLSINSVSGALSGIAPSVVGVSTALIEAVNSAGAATLAVAISVVGSPVQITTTALPVIAAGVARTLPIAIAGTGPFVLSVVSGSLPAGATIVGQSISIADTIAAGTTAFTLRATGPTGAADDQAYVLTVQVEPVPEPEPEPDGQWVRISRVADLWVRVPRD
jgi:hypothetical protein